MWLSRLGTLNGEASIIKGQSQIDCLSSLRMSGQLVAVLAAGSIHQGVGKVAPKVIWP